VGVVLSSQTNRKEPALARIEQSIDVNVPVRVAYDQWTQFESFPEFMEGVESVRQLDDTHLHWTATIAGKRQEWDAEITGQLPDQRVAWRSTSGDRNAGAVDFHRLSDASTNVALTMDVEPSSVIEKVGTAVGITGASVKGDLERFKAFIERRQSPTGAWRGEVERGQVAGSSSGDREVAGAGSMSTTGSSSELVDRDFGTGMAGGAGTSDPYLTSGSSTVYDTGRDGGMGGSDDTADRGEDAGDLGTGHRLEDRDM
jgi:uncharacterized membrane protein